MPAASIAPARALRRTLSGCESSPAAPRAWRRTSSRRARAAQRHVAADRLAFAHLEGRHGLAGLRHLRLLAGELREIADRVVDDLLVRHGFADAHVDRDLGDLRYLHDVLQLQRLLQLRHDFFAIGFLEARHYTSTCSL